MGWLKPVKTDGEKQLDSLGSRKDVVDGHVIKQQHERLPVLKLALWQNDTVVNTWLIIGIIT